MWRTAAVCQGRRAQGGRRLRRTSSTAAVGERGRAAWLCVSVCTEAGLGGAGRAGPAAHSSVAAAWRAWSRGRRVGCRAERRASRPSGVGPGCARQGREKEGRKKEEKKKKIEKEKEREKREGESGFAP